MPYLGKLHSTQLIRNGRFPGRDKDFTRKIMSEMENLCTALGADLDLSSDFTTEEIDIAIKHLKPNKAPGIEISTLSLSCTRAKEWLCHLYVCFKTSWLPKIWSRAKIIALARPNKPLNNLKSYSPISLLCIPYELLECLLHARLNPIIDPQLPKAQADFQCGKSTTDQATLQHIKQCQFTI